MRYSRKYWIPVILLTLSQPALFAGDCSFQRTLQVNGPVNLEVLTGSGNIEVSPGDANQVQVCGHIRTSEWFGGNVDEKVKRIKDNPPIQQSGNDLRIGHIDDLELRHNISIGFDLIVPSATTLHSHSGSGNQEVRDIRGPVCD